MTSIYIYPSTLANQFDTNYIIFRIAGNFQKLFLASKSKKIIVKD
jgi:hypothetical protein